MAFYLLFIGYYVTSALLLHQGEGIRQGAEESPSSRWKTVNQG
jgi:hypothetical protein